MPRGILSNETRLQIRVTRLQNSVVNLKKTVRELLQSNKEKDRTIALLHLKLHDKESQRKELLSYLYRPGRTSDSTKPKGKKPGAKGFQRPKPKESSVTEEHSYLLTKCPACKHPVGGVVDTVIKFEEDINLVPVNIVKKYTITRHWCARCEEYVRSADVPIIKRIGNNVLGYILYARYRLNLPLSKIQESLRDLHNFKISEGEIVEKLKEAEVLFGKDYQSICELIKQAKIVHADETGWRMNGENWWLWVFVTPKGDTRFTIEETRGKGVAQDALGNKQDRVIISDGYAAYKNLAGFNQQCWVHLLRAAKLRSMELYGDLAQLYQRLILELEKPVLARDTTYFTGELEKMIEKRYDEPLADKVQQRLQRDMPAFLTCLKFEGVRPENNTAERAIRPQVIMRKIFGGSRSLAGAKAHEINSSVLATLKNQNTDKNFFQALTELIDKRSSGS
jgi:transposase